MNRTQHTEATKALRHAQTLLMQADEHEAQAMHTRNNERWHRRRADELRQQADDIAARFATQPTEP